MNTNLQDDNMATSVYALPEEILHDIFRRLHGLELIRCREVCRRWRDAVDGLSDNDWKKICDSDYLREDYAIAREKYGLSWRDTFCALNSWSKNKIRTANMDIRELNISNVQYLKVLPNSIIACLQNNRNQRYNNGYSDTIVYYNLETAQECGKEEFNFAFSSRNYEENEHFRVLTKYNGKLCVVVKANKKQYFVGHLDKYDNILHFLEEYFTEFTLIGKELYFKNSKDEVIYVSKLVTKNGKVTVKTVPLEAFDKNHDSFCENIVAFSFHNGLLHILTDEANIYVHEKADFGSVTSFDEYTYDMFHELEYFGFNWRSRAVFDWVLSDNSPRMVNPFNNAFYAHGNVILTARTFLNQVDIFCKPNYKIHGLEDLGRVVKSRPTRCIDLKLILNASNMTYKTIRQLDIVETGSTHKVVVLVHHQSRSDAPQKRLFVLEFDPMQKQHMNLRSRKIKRDISTKGPGSHRPKSKKTINKRVIQHCYATRSLVIL